MHAIIIKVIVFALTGRVPIDNFYIAEFTRHFLNMRINRILPVFLELELLPAVPAPPQKVILIKIEADLLNGPFTPINNPLFYFAIFS
ncbi:hypothetical protein BXP28_01005 [Paenibacillus larvae subsp. larvae]|nr:hypothetical protein BXP28_01005 [Paenibacillus larvae subsp. larvae]